VLDGSPVRDPEQVVEDELGAREDTLRAGVAEVPLGDDVEHLGILQGLARLTGGFSPIPRGRRQCRETITGMRTALLVVVTVISLVTAPVPVASAAAQSAPRPAAVTQVSSDPFTNGSSYHATEVEPDTYAVHV
jgi:hypothetical protein